MAYHLIEPDVAGQLGEHTIMDTSVHPPRITALHYALDDWTGDDLLESTPAFIITTQLADTLDATDFTGYTLADVEVTLSETGEELLDGAELPDFQWLQITGAPGSDDFGLTPDADLIVSDQALETLRTGNLNGCDIAEWTEQQ